MTFYCNITFNIINFKDIEVGDYANVNGLGVQVQREQLKKALNIVKPSIEQLKDEFDLITSEAVVVRHDNYCKLFMAFKSTDIADLAAFGSHFVSMKTNDFQVDQIVLSNYSLDSDGVCVFKAKKKTKKPSAK